MCTQRFWANSQECAKELRKLQSKDLKSKVELNALVLNVTAEGLLGSEDEEVRAVLASILADLIRLYVPDAPFDDDALGRVFGLFIDQFGALGDPEGHGFARACNVVERLAEVDAMLLLLDSLPARMCDVVRLLLSGMSPALEPATVNSAVRMLETLVKEADDVGQDVLQEFLLALTPESKRTRPASFRAAQTVVGWCARKLQPAMERYFRSVLQPDLFERDVLPQVKGFTYELIWELHRLDRDMLVNVIPALEHGLAYDEVADRLGAVKLLSALFVDDPGAARAYADLYLRFTARFADVDEDVRVILARFCADFVSARDWVLDAADEFGLCAMLQEHVLDSSEAVREAVVDAVCAAALACPDAVPAPLVNAVVHRMRDKRPVVSRAAVLGLARLHHALQDSHGADWFVEPGRGRAEKYAEIPERVLACYSLRDTDVRAAVVEALGDYVWHDADTVDLLLELAVESDPAARAAFALLARDCATLRRLWADVSARRAAADDQAAAVLPLTTSAGRAIVRRLAASGDAATLVSQAASAAEVAAARDELIQRGPGDAGARAVVAHMLAFPFTYAHFAAAAVERAREGESDEEAGVLLGALARLAKHGAVAVAPVAPTVAAWVRETQGARRAGALRLLAARVRDAVGALDTRARRALLAELMRAAGGDRRVAVLTQRVLYAVGGVDALRQAHAAGLPAQPDAAALAAASEALALSKATPVVDAASAADRAIAVLRAGARVEVDRAVAAARLAASACDALARARHATAAARVGETVAELRTLVARREREAQLAAVKALARIGAGPGERLLPARAAYEVMFAAAAAADADTREEAAQRLARGVVAVRLGLRFLALAAALAPAATRRRDRAALEATLAEAVRSRAQFASSARAKALLDAKAGSAAQRQALLPSFALLHAVHMAQYAPADGWPCVQALLAALAAAAVDPDSLRLPLLAVMRCSDAVDAARTEAMHATAARAITALAIDEASSSSTPPDDVVLPSIYKNAPPGTFRVPRKRSGASSMSAQASQATTDEEDNDEEEEPPRRRRRRGPVK